MRRIEPGNREPRAQHQSASPAMAAIFTNIKPETPPNRCNRKNGTPPNQSASDNKSPANKNRLGVSWPSTTARPRLNCHHKSGFVSGRTANIKTIATSVALVHRSAEHPTGWFFEIERDGTTSRSRPGTNEDSRRHQIGGCRKWNAERECLELAHDGTIVLVAQSPPRCQVKIVAHESNRPVHQQGMDPPRMV